MPSRDRDRVGQIEFALGVAIADLLEDFERDVAAQAPSARRCTDRCARSASLASLLLADRDEPMAVHDQPAVAGRIGGRKPSTATLRRADRARRAGACSVSALISGVSPKMTRMSSAPLRSRLRAPAPHAPCRAARSARRLCAFGNARVASSATASAFGPTTTATAFRAGAAHRRQHMRQQRAPRDLVQHLRPRRAHARALAGGEHDRKAGAFAHRYLGRRRGRASYWRRAPNGKVHSGEERRRIYGEN